MGSLGSEESQLAKPGFEPNSGPAVVPAVLHTLGAHPVVICVPHGGYALPTYISDRAKRPNVCLEHDGSTMELSESLQLELESLGVRAHYVRLNLNRKKLDANRRQDQSCDEHEELANAAWLQYHGAVKESILICQVQL